MDLSDVGPRPERDPGAGAWLLGGEPLVLAPPVYWQRLHDAAVEALDQEAAPIIIGAVAQAVYAQLGQVFRAHGAVTLEARRLVARQCYRAQGWGVLNVSRLEPSGGVVVTQLSFESTAWRQSHGRQREPMAWCEVGWLAGAVAAIHELPLGSFRVRQTSCMSMGAPVNRFEIERGDGGYKVFSTPARVHARPPTQATGIPSLVKAARIEGALQLGRFVADDEGSIAVSGQPVAWHWGLACTRIAVELVRVLERRFGHDGVVVGERALVGTGQRVAFHLLGELLAAREWQRQVRELGLERADAVVAGALAASALGFGQWTVLQATPERIELMVHDDFETLAMAALVGGASRRASFFVRGVASAIAGLAYLADLRGEPAMTPQLFARLFEHAGGYEAHAETEQVAGAEATFLVVRRG